MENSYKRRILTENILIGVFTAIALATLVASFFPSAPLSGFLMHALELKKMTARVFSALLLVALFNLYQRKQAAWRLTEALLLLSLARHLVPPVAPVFVAVAAADAAGVVVLAVLHSDFCCPSERQSVRRGLLLLVPVAAGVVFNAALTYHYVRQQMAGVPGRVLFGDSIREACSVLLGTTYGGAPGFPSARFEDILFWFSWACIFFAVLYFLRPWIQRFLWTEKDMQRARAIVMKYGQNPSSYLTLEDDKFLYFSKQTEGVLPYGIVKSTVVVNGDPICPPEQFPLFLAEFREFCQKSSHKIVFSGITGCFLEEYQRQGFGVVKCGEEARFDVASYDISGKKGAKMRMNINHAANAGLTVHEYRPLEQRDPAVEAAMDSITAEWLSDKKGGLLTFTIGSVGLDRPMDRRYFYAADLQGHICGYTVFCPFDGGAGYMADITRRSHDAPGGVTEKIMYDALLIFRREGVKSVSLGIAPLANILPPDARPNSVQRLLNFVYEHLNACYGFKDLYRAKEKYSPTQWLPGYYAWLPKLPTPEMFYALVRIQNKRGVGDYVKSFFKNSKNGG